MRRTNPIALLLALTASAASAMLSSCTVQDTTPDAPSQGLPATQTIQDGSQGAERPRDVGRSGYDIRVIEVSPVELRIEAEFGPAVTPAGSSMLLMCSVANATLERGFEFFAVRHATDTMMVDLFHKAPAGWTVVSDGSPPVGDRLTHVDPVRSVVDARFFADGCARMGVPNTTTKIDVTSAIVPTSATAGVLTGSLFVTCPGIEEIRTITWLPATADAPDRACIAGRSGAVIVETDGSVHSTVDFDVRGSEVVPFDVEGDGIPEFMDRGGGWGDVKLLEHDGRVRWSFPVKGSDVHSAPDRMAGGDLNKDGVAEFVVGMNGSGGVYVLDAQGQVTNHWDGGNVFGVDIVDVDGDGVLEILHTGSRSSRSNISVRNGQGQELSSLSPGFSNFRLFTSSAGETRLSQIVGGELLLANLEGRIVERRPVSPSGHKDAELAWVRFELGRAPYLAVARTIGASAGRAEFYIFDPDGELVHHEVLPHSSLALATLPLKEAGREALLVGSGIEVRRWELAP